MMIGRSIFAASLLIALTAAPASAQQHHGAGGPGGHVMQRSTMGGGMMGMMSMMQSMRPGPGMLLQASDALGLTAEQKKQLTTLRDQARPDHQQHMQAAMAAHREAASILEGDSPDLDAYAETLERATGHMVRAHVAMTRTSLEARQILTSEQLETLDKVRTLMRTMHRGMTGGMPGGMPGAMHGGN